MKKDFLVIGGLFALIIGLLIVNSSVNIFLRDLTPEAVSTTQVKIGTSTGSVLEITAEVAKTPKTRSYGLSARESLAENSGMLFVFDEVSRHRFWMKDVKFPIDIVWISQDKQIADITHTALPELGTPDNLLRIYQPAEPVKYVLEVAARTAVNNSLRIGDKVEFGL